MSTPELISSPPETAGSLDPALALKFAGLSDLAYRRFEDNAELLAQPLANTGYRLVKSIHNKATGTQAILVQSKEHAVLVFRGTEPDRPEDLATDLNANLEDGWHSGFLKAFNSVKVEVESALALLDNSTELYVTGHSLGGALAKMAVLHFQTRIKQCYTYGSPAISVKEKSENNKVPLFVIVNNSDIVPRATFIAPGAVAVLVLLIKAVHGIVRAFNPKFKANDTYVQKLILLAESTKQLQHFGTILIVDDSGNLNSDSDMKDFFKVFWTMVSKDYKKVALEHNIEAYIAKLKRKNETLVATSEQPAE